MSDNDKLTITVDEAAKMLGVAQSTFLKWCNEYKCSEISKTKL